mmetsp:Transcript_13969/g.40233  ORF Transcript_13969/g.40233 Transcript_13969/m.40233 type:complete len:242 (+) Transcript_13969:1112-1837(+)
MLKPCVTSTSPSVSLSAVMLARIVATLKGKPKVDSSTSSRLPASDDQHVSSTASASQHEASAEAVVGSDSRRLAGGSRSFASEPRVPRSSPSGSWMVGGALPSTPHTLVPLKVEAKSVGPSAVRPRTTTSASFVAVVAAISSAPAMKRAKATMPAQTHERPRSWTPQPAQQQRRLSLVKAAAGAATSRESVTRTSGRMKRARPTRKEARLSEMSVSPAGKSLGGGGPSGVGQARLSRAPTV